MDATITQPRLVVTQQNKLYEALRANGMYEHRGINPTESTWE
jgi:hypothetical protein